MMCFVFHAYFDESNSISICYCYDSWIIFFFSFSIGSTFLEYDWTILIFVNFQFLLLFCVLFRWLARIWKLEHSGLLIIFFLQMIHFKLIRFNIAVCSSTNGTLMARGSWYWILNKLRFWVMADYMKSFCVQSYFKNEFVSIIYYYYHQMMI